MQCHVNGFRRYCEGRAFGDKECHRRLKKRQDHHRSAPELQTSRPQAQFLSDTRLLSEAVPATDLSATIANWLTLPKLLKFADSQGPIAKPQRRQFEARLDNQYFSSLNFWVLATFLVGPNSDETCDV